MPELPEVETICQGIRCHLIGQRIYQVIVRQQQLRWPVPLNLIDDLPSQVIHAITRRGKYLLFKIDQGSLIMHLGMSGHIRILPTNTPNQKHDHIDIAMENGDCLRFNDPRRFGALLWAQHPDQHPLLVKLGPEPLSNKFTANYLYQQTRKRKTPIKTFIMDSHIVVGVGNIYANEALFSAHINPLKKAEDISQEQCNTLTRSIKNILSKAIKQGGTTLKDFKNSEGKPGYFKQQLQVYGRGDKACNRCEATLKEIRINNRTTVYCTHCQY